MFFFFFGKIKNRFVLKMEKKGPKSNTDAIYPVRRLRTQTLKKRNKNGVFLREMPVWSRSLEEEEEAVKSVRASFQSPPLPWRNRDPLPLSHPHSVSLPIPFF